MQKGLKAFKTLQNIEKVCPKQIKKFLIVKNNDKNFFSNARLKYKSLYIKIEI